MLIKQLLISGLWLGCVSMVFADTRVIAQDLPGLHQKDAKGDYDAFYAKAGIKLEVLPVARAYNEFEGCVDCCLTPSNKDPEFYDYNKPSYIESKPLDVAKVYIFSPPGKPVEVNINALKGKRIGGRIGMPYGKSVEKALPDIQLTPELVQSIKKLEAGRLDFLVDYEPDVISALKAMGMAALPYDASKPLSAHRDSLLCKDTPANRKLIEKLNSIVR